MLGLVGGLAEFLPVGASGHRLLVARILFGSAYSRQFAGVCELAAAAAALISLRKELLALLSTGGRRVALALAAAAVPAILLSLPFVGTGGGLYYGPGGVGALFLVSGLSLYVAEELGRRVRQLADLGLPGSLLVGLLQVLAVLPGISRTGLAISGAMLAGVERGDAVRFALMLSIPLLLFAGVWDLLHANGSTGASPLILGAITTFVAGYGAVRLMLNFSQNFSMMAFAYYLWVAGALAVAYAAFG